MHTSFWKAGHPPTLFAAFLYFDLSFMVWYVLGPLGVQIAADLGLTTQQRSLMVLHRFSPEPFCVSYWASSLTALRPSLPGCLARWW